MIKKSGDNEKYHVYAVIAPSISSQFTYAKLGQVVTGLHRLGFYSVAEAALGADMVADAESRELVEKGFLTSSCCPGFVNLIRLHYPDLLDHISTTVSPMCAVSRWIKSKDPEAITVFVGPCIAKKSEVIDQDIPGSADYAMTYGEIRAIIRAKGITIHEAEETNQQSSTFGKWFGNSCGVTDAVLEGMKEQGITDEVNVERCNGTDACKRALLMLKMGRFSGDFIEGMACDGGCVGGPSRHGEVNKFKRARENMIKKADKRNIHENLEKLGAEKIPMHRSDWTENK